MLWWPVRHRKGDALNHLTRYKISCREPAVHATQHTRTTVNTRRVIDRLARGQLHRLVRRYVAPHKDLLLGATRAQCPASPRRDRTELLRRESGSRRRSRSNRPCRPLRPEPATPMFSVEVHQAGVVSCDGIAERTALEKRGCRKQRIEGGRLRQCLCRPADHSHRNLSVIRLHG